MRPAFLPMVVTMKILVIGGVAAGMSAASKAKRTDPGARVQGAQRDLHVELVATTSLPGNLLKQRLRWLAGSGWELRDVTAA